MDEAEPRRLIDADKIVAWLEEHQAQPPYEQPPLLVRNALYEGLINRIKEGQFDPEKGH